MDCTFPSIHLPQSAPPFYCVLTRYSFKLINAWYYAGQKPFPANRNGLNREPSSFHQKVGLFWSLLNAKSSVITAFWASCLRCCHSCTVKCHTIPFFLFKALRLDRDSFPRLIPWQLLLCYCMMGSLLFRSYITLLVGRPHIKNNPCN